MINKSLKLHFVVFGGNDSDIRGRVFFFMDKQTKTSNYLYFKHMMNATKMNFLIRIVTVDLKFILIL